MSPPQAYNISSQLEERLKGRRAALNALRDLPEDYFIFYTPSLRREPIPESVEPVVDYIIAHRDKGLLGVVVRGGEIVEEPSGLVSQYQPLGQLYKIIDPIKPADTALRALLEVFNKEATRLYPCGIAVLFPDAQRVEFSQPKNSYVFGEEITPPALVEKLDSLFLMPIAEEDRHYFLQNFTMLCNFLREHADNGAVFQEGKDRLRLVQTRKATEPSGQGSVRMKVAKNKGKAQGSSAASAVRASAALPESAVDRKVKEVLSGAMQMGAKSSAITKAEKAHQQPLALTPAIAAAPIAPPRPMQQDMFGWLQEVDTKGEGDASLSPLQWIVVVGVASAAIAVIYLLSQRLGALI
jgi:hypothetical protein